MSILTSSSSSLGGPEHFSYLQIHSRIGMCGNDSMVGLSLDDLDVDDDFDHVDADDVDADADSVETRRALLNSRGSGSLSCLLSLIPSSLSELPAAHL